ncbi:MAG: SAM-dependent methyltransferase [Pseudomonadota bacterium]
MTDTPLEILIKREIAANGPVTIARYMDVCLAHPKHGYYMTRDPLGAAGDFTTAPEISQMFGEIVGAWLVDAWDRIGRPPRFTLLECGPGRGTLMADILRVGALRPDFLNGADIVLLETSPVLQNIQSKTLDTYPHRHATALQDAIAPDLPILLVGNEFFDALPIHQYVRDSHGWRERLVGLDTSDRLVFGLGNMPVDLPQQGPLHFYEASPVSRALLKQVCAAIKDQGGAAIFIDYGSDDTADTGDTLQAVRQHRKSDPLRACGEADVTAHVDFAALRDVVIQAGLIPTITTQSSFLQQNGLAARQAVLARKSQDIAAKIQGEVDRLTHPDHMGTLFKVLIVRHDAG